MDRFPSTMGRPVWRSTPNKGETLNKHNHPRDQNKTMTNLTCGSDPRLSLITAIRRHNGRRPVEECRNASTRFGAEGPGPDSSRAAPARSREAPKSAPRKDPL